MDEREQIKERIPIVELISESVTLKKAGRNFKGLCPFHGERSPSFVVSPERQIWHCFGCGKGGDIFTFLMEIDRLEFPDALNLLAKRAGVTLKKRAEVTQQQKTKEQLLEIHHMAEEYYQYLLINHPIGERARLYLKNRGLGDKLIKTFGLGFAPQAWDNLTKYLKKKGYQDQLLEISGLVLKGKHGLYDRFRGRIMFPLKNYRSETIAFSGRVLETNAKEAKYVNSPETLLYTKGDMLYALNLTKDAIRRENTAILVEGEFDVISSFQIGVGNVVAIKGSALTEAQVRLIKRFAERIILSLDQDKAGDAASRRGIEIAERAGLDIRVIGNILGKDPDETARESPDLWKKAIKDATPYYDFLISSAFSRHNAQEAYGKKKISDELLPILHRIENTIVQAHYIKVLARELSLSEEKLYEAMHKVKLPLNLSQQVTAAKPQAPPNHEELMEEHLFSLLLSSSQLSQVVEVVCHQIDPSDMVHPVIKKIMMALIDEINQTSDLTLKAFIQTLSPEFIPTIDRLYLVESTAPGDGLERSHQLQKVINTVKKNILRRKIKETSTYIAIAEKHEEEEKLNALQQELAQATLELKKLN